jgi:excisionase family DNA binding protein
MLIDIITKDDLANLRQELLTEGNKTYHTPVLSESEEFWRMLRKIIREELDRNNKSTESSFKTPGLTEKPLFKISEVTELFQVSKPTIYEWIKKGTLKPYKVNSRVYFLWQDVKKLLDNSRQESNKSQ